MDNQANRHLADLDGLRGILAIIVVVYHYGLTTALRSISHGITDHGQWTLCVDLFFMLSGFVLMRSFCNRPVGGATFLLRRAIRLYPLTTLATLFSIGIAAIAGTVEPPIVVAANILSIQSLVGLPSINGPSWSVPFEIFIPALAVAVFGRWMVNMTTAASFMLLAFGLIVGSVGIHTTNPLDMEGFARSVGGLAIGAALYRLRAPTLDAPVRASAALLPFACVLIIMALADRSWVILTAFYPFAIATLWFASGTKSVLSSRPIQFLGKISFPIYLCHIPILAVTMAIRGGELHGMAIKLALLGTSIGVATVLERAVERPIITKLKSFRRRPLPPKLATNPERF